MNRWLILALLTIIFSCKEEEEDPSKEAFFPVKSFLQSQVTQVDSSIYRIIKITTTGGKKDTAFVKREEFKTLAKDFLDIPDIASKKWRNDYKESQIYDDQIENAVFNYMPVDEDGEIRRQDVIIKPSREGDKVQTIFIERLLEEKGEPVRKLLTWEVDKRFKIVTIKKMEKGPEQVETMEVVWSERAPAE
jgi:hypothetical protein